MLPVIFILFVLSIFSGTPIVFAIGTVSAAFLYIMDVPMNTVAIRMMAGLDSFPLMAIPFFVLAGQLMDRGGIARRIIEWASAIVGWITGSLLQMTIVAGAGFAAITGSGSASTAALSSIILPEIRKRGYDVDFTAVMLAASGLLGPIIPPSLFMVVLATCSPITVSVKDLFIGGIIPGLMMCAAMMFYAYRFAKTHGSAYRTDKPFSWKDVITTTIKALPGFLMPVIVVGGIITGAFTATEAAAIAVLVGLIVGLFIYRELKWSEIPGILIDTGAITAGIMVICGMASVFSWLIAINNLPEIVGNFMTTFSSSKIVFLLVVNIFLLIVGCFMETVSALLILIPVIMPIAVNNYGIDPVHFAVIVVINLAIGTITPPYGICLYVAAAVAGRTIKQVMRYVWVPIAIYLAALLIFTYVPQIVLFLPNMLK
ncbi:MAG: TRAP transporter large permease [Pyramidobacter sp.]|nr:TRAP transporter large permease [Pyramidobacter sp.]